MGCREDGLGCRIWVVCLGFDMGRKRRWRLGERGRKRGGCIAMVSGASKIDIGEVALWERMIRFKAYR